MSPTPDRSRVIVTASLGAVVAGLAVVVVPELLPVLALAVTVTETSALTSTNA